MVVTTAADAGLGRHSDVPGGGGRRTLSCERVHAPDVITDDEGDHNHHNVPRATVRQHAQVEHEDGELREQQAELVEPDAYVADLRTVDARQDGAPVLVCSVPFGHLSIAEGTRQEGSLPGRRPSCPRRILSTRGGPDHVGNLQQAGQASAGPSSGIFQLHVQSPDRAISELTDDCRDSKGQR